MLRRVDIALFLAWLVGYFAHWLSGYDWARPAAGIASIVFVLTLGAGVMREPKDPPKS